MKKITLPESILSLLREAAKLPKIEPSPLTIRPKDSMQLYWMVFEPSMLVVDDSDDDEIITKSIVIC